MKYIQELLSNRILIISITGWAVAQILKTIINFGFTKKLDPERLVGSGGMPSSHSATVMALVTSTGINYGAGSYQFALAGILALIVMHDAMGVRRETGIQAKVLNSMMDFFTDMGKEMPVEDKLKEFVGHTPLQVCMGAILGILVGFAVCAVMI